MAEIRPISIDPVSPMKILAGVERPTSVGRPLPTIEVLVVGADGTRLGPGEPGDLYFRNLMGIDFEYHKAEAKTEAAHLEPGVGTLGPGGSRELSTVNDQE